MTSRKSLIVSSIACLVAASSACAWAAASTATSGSRERPASSAQGSVASLPESATTASPQQTAAQAAWDDYQTTVFEGLSKSPDPRDRVLATLTEAWRLDARKSNQSNQDQRVALLQSAGRAVPDDMLVQWIATRAQRDDPNAEARQILRRAESDNAAVWLLDLDDAMRRKDQAAANLALQKMSVSTRFDLHYAELIKALTEAFQRYARTETDTSSFREQSDQPSKEAIAFFSAISIAAATALPAFQTITNACRVNISSGENVSRAGDCAAIGRLMAAHGDDFIANRIGSALLRVSQTFNQDDVEVARGQAWIYDQYASIVHDWDGPAAASGTVALLQDWIETGTELDAMRRSVARADKPASPPQDWVDPQSPFSAERLQLDETWVKHRPITQ